MSKNIETKCCIYCNEEIEGNDYKKIVRFNQSNKILNRFRNLEVCNNCIAIMANRDELSTDWAHRYNADYNLVIDQQSQRQF